MRRVVWLLLCECFNRTGWIITVLTVAFGGFLGYRFAGFVKVSEVGVQSIGLAIVVGAAIAFLFDFFFISPIRLWLKAEKRLVAAQAGSSVPKVKWSRTAEGETLEAEGLSTPDQLRELAHFSDTTQRESPGPPEETTIPATGWSSLPSAATDAAAPITYSTGDRYAIPFENPLMPSSDDTTNVPAPHSAEDDDTS
jgi:hypothetical protein